MKKILFTLSIIALIGITSSCDNDDSPSAQTEPIEKSWYLEKITGGLIGINIDYRKEDVIWTFDGNKNTVEVENNIMTTGPENIYSGFATGTYSYETLEDGDLLILKIDGREQGAISFTENVLTIDDGLAADGFLRTFNTGD